jgi:hypothetical protein
MIPSINLSMTIELSIKSSQRGKFVQNHDKIGFSSKRKQKGVLMSLRDNAK